MQQSGAKILWPVRTGQTRRTEDISSMIDSVRGGGFDLLEPGCEHVASVLQGFDQHEKEDCTGQKQGYASEPVMRTEFFQGWCKSDKGKAGGKNDDGVPTSALPIAAAQAYPHAELVESQSHANAIKYCGPFETLAGGAAEQQVSGDGGEQKNAVVQVVHMCAAQMQIKVWNRARHN